MSYRPYPNRDRALHQLDRHGYEIGPHASEADRYRSVIYRAYRIPPRLLGVRPASSEEKTA